MTIDIIIIILIFFKILLLNKFPIASCWGMIKSQSTKLIITILKNIPSPYVLYNKNKFDKYKALGKLDTLKQNSNDKY